MDYKKLIERLKNAAGGPEGVAMCRDAATAITDLLIANHSLRYAANGFKDQAKKAEERAEKAKRERDAAVFDLTSAVNQYRLLTTDIDLCGLCKFDLPPSSENGQTYECPGYYKDDCFEWRGIKEE